jgi:photosystem II stability/assembly factor-like uncharacterized protein
MAALLAGSALATGAEPRHLDDACLRAVQFVDDNEGWAVGDDGVILHTIDAGRNWERQPSGVNASLRSVHFQSPYVGWVAGREELPGGGGSGVVLYTRDAGLKWQRLLVNSLPGLHLVRFIDERTGYLAGDGCEQFPSGVFATTNGGRSWAPLPGPRAPSWRAGDFNAEGGALAGAWNRLATVRRAQVFSVDMDTLGGRCLCGLELRGDGGVAVGQGGLVLLSSRSRGSSWHYADLKLPAGVQASWDFHAVGGTGRHVWAVGKPGSAALHSPDGGQTWEVVRTGQTLPLQGVFFRDEKKGWLVGELGTVLCTLDGGKTWKVARRGGERSAVLSVHARPNGAPLDALGLLGGAEGYLTTTLCVTAPEPGSSELARVAEACRLTAAARQAGGAGGETLWQFPVGSHLASADRDGLLAAWNKPHGNRAAEQLLRQLVLAIRVYRPDVVLTDDPRGPSGAEALTAEAVKEAFRQASDPSAYPEQLTSLGLQTHQAKKLYGLWAKGASSTDHDAQVRHDLTAFRPPLGSTPREFVSPAASLLSADPPPKERCYKLLAASLEGAQAHREIMQGILLAPGGPARRALAPPEETTPQTLKAVRARANLWAIAEAPATEMTSPERLLANIGPTLAGMPEDAGARTAHALAGLYARKGQWGLARETHLLLVDLYPAHPLAVQSVRWLMMHQASSEARRRHELGQFLVVEQVSGGVPGKPQTVVQLGPSMRAKDAKVKRRIDDVPSFETKREREIGSVGTKEDVRRWHQGCLALEKKLSGFGPLYSQDPAIQFCLQSARRQLGEVKEALDWYRQFASGSPDGPWRRCALAELWLSNRTGAPPKPVLTCKQASARPWLDGKLDDSCWLEARPVRLQPACGDTARYVTEVRTAYDREFLYFAVRCGHPAGEAVEAAKVRTRDGDQRLNDRISILLDLDRDYSTCFHLQVDQAGCVLEDCWGDKTWNPRWFVAIHREATAWTAEIAVPRNALTGDHVTPGRAWAANVVRVLPGRGVQAFSLPAEAPEVATRPEGLGLLMFVQDEANQASRTERPAALPR